MGLINFNDCSKYLQVGMFNKKNENESFLFNYKLSKD